MNDVNLKVNMIKFLMTMFETSCDNAKAVASFKLNVNELIRRGQIPLEVKEIIYSIYGIENTDVYKPNMQSEKLMQLNMLMLTYERMNGSSKDIANFKEHIDYGVKNGTILKSCKDIVYRIYDLDSFSKASKSEPAYTMNTPQKRPMGYVLSTSELKEVLSTDTPKPSKEVLNDRKKFKPEYLDEIFYEYPNPSYDGCCGSSKYLHTCLKEALTKPNNCTLVRRRCLSDDGCHQSFGFVSIPDSYYASVSKPKPVIQPSVRSTRVIAPTRSSGLDCSGGGGYAGRRC